VSISLSVVALFDSESESAWRYSPAPARKKNSHTASPGGARCVVVVRSICAGSGRVVRGRWGGRLQERESERESTLPFRTHFTTWMYMYKYVYILAPWLFCIFPASASALLLLLHSNFTHWIPEILSYSRSV